MEPQRDLRLTLFKGLKKKKVSLKRQLLTKSGGTLPLSKHRKRIAFGWEGESEARVSYRKLRQGKGGIRRA